MGLISVADLDARKVEYEDSEQAQAVIDDASAAVRLYVSPILDAVEAPDAPEAVVAVVAAMARRALANPRGLAQESLGDYSFAMGGTGGVATLLPTTRERRLLRMAATAYAKANDLDVPAFGTGGVYMQADLPVPEDGPLNESA